MLDKLKTIFIPKKKKLIIPKQEETSRRKFFWYLGGAAAAASLSNILPETELPVVPKIKSLVPKIKSLVMNYNEDTKLWTAKGEILIPEVAWVSWHLKTEQGLKEKLKTR